MEKTVTKKLENALANLFTSSSLYGAISSSFPDLYPNQIAIVGGENNTPKTASALIECMVQRANEVEPYLGVWKFNVMVRVYEAAREVEPEAISSLADTAFSELVRVDTNLQSYHSDTGSLNIIAMFNMAQPNPMFQGDMLVNELDMEVVAHG